MSETAVSGWRVGGQVDELITLAHWPVSEGEREKLDSGLKNRAVEEETEMERAERGEKRERERAKE